MTWPDDYENKIIHGDCIEILLDLPDECIDLVFADPPFNIRKSYSGVSDKRRDYREWCSEWIHQCFRVLNTTGSFYLMTLTRHLEWLLPIMAKHGVFINLITWRNVSACHSKWRFWNEYQPIALYAKTNDYIFYTYAQTEDTGQRRWGGYTTKYRGQLKDRWDDIPFIYAGSIQHKEAILEPGTKKKAHPAQMPVGLAYRAILFSTNETDIVLDPFVGSGTTAIAAIRSGRRFLGIEMSQKYVDIAQRRIEKELSQLTLPVW